MTAALTFQNTQFDVIEKSNQFWLSSSDIAQALGYKSSRSITNIFTRNADEFSHSMTEVLKLSTSGNYLRTIRIFSLRGAHLIAMFARTAIAKQFRTWVLDILDKESQVQSFVQIPDINWPLTYKTDWRAATLQLFDQTACYIRFDLQPKPFSCEFSAKYTPQIYQAVFGFADQNKCPITPYQRKPAIGDFGYFESTSLEDLWIQVTSFLARCNSQCALF